MLLTLGVNSVNLIPNPTAEEAIVELMSICDPLGLQIIRIRTDSIKYAVSLGPLDTLILEREWYYWTVQSLVGLSKDAALKLCSTHGQDIRALGYGRRGLTVDELRETLCNRYYAATGQRCCSWHVDTLDGLRVLFDRLIEENEGDD